MLDPVLVDTVRRLLAERKWSMRKIARMAGVSRGTVGAIAHNKRRDRPRPTDEEDLLAQPSGPLRRCPGCGGLVQMPCRLCRVRAQGRQAFHPVPAPAGRAAPSGARRRAPPPLRGNPCPPAPRRTQ